MKVRQTWLFCYSGTCWENCWFECSCQAEITCALVVISADLALLRTFKPRPGEKMAPDLHTE